MTLSRSSLSHLSYFFPLSLSCLLPGSLSLVFLLVRLSQSNLILIASLVRKLIFKFPTLHSLLFFFTFHSSISKTTMSSQNPDAPSASTSSSSSFDPFLGLSKATENGYPENGETPSSRNPDSLSPTKRSWEEPLVQIPGSIVHLIDKDHSVELASGEFTIVRLWQGSAVVAVLARIGDKIQWPLAKDEVAVKLDESHYFFTLRIPPTSRDILIDGGDDGGGNGEILVEREGEEFLNYGLTIASKGQQDLLKELDGVLEYYSNFSVQKVNGIQGSPEVLNGSVATETMPADMASEKKREEMEENSAVFWTTMAPNVEDYSSSVARMIAAGTGQLIKGIILCGDVTVDRLNWGNGFLKERIKPGLKREISPETFRRIERVQSLTKMSEEVATGILSGVVKVSEFVTSSLANSSMGKKFFSRQSGEIVLASLDGFSKFVDAIEVVGRNIMSNTSVVTTGLVSQRYGADAAHATNQGLDAAGHAIGTAWAVFKIRKAINPKSIIKPTNLAKAASEAKSADLKANQVKAVMV